MKYNGIHVVSRTGRRVYARERALSVNDVGAFVERSKIPLEIRLTLNKRAGLEVTVHAVLVFSTRP